MCLTPYSVEKVGVGKVGVPCGVCPECKKRRVSGWSFRLMEEDRVSSSSHFITLTYAPEHVPITPNGFMTLDKKDVQLFLKRLRKSMFGSKSGNLKYFAVGEYGTQFNRPHYHLIMFNVDLDKISPSWQKGEVYFGTVSGASVGYCLKYMSKDSKIPMHKNDDRLKEFALMSKKLGLSYLGEIGTDYFEEETPFVNPLSGEKFKIVKKKQ